MVATSPPEAWTVQHRFGMLRMGCVVTAWWAIPRNIVYSPHEDQLASVSYDNTIRLWNLEAGSECRLTLTGHSDKVIGIAYSPRGDLLAHEQLGQDGTIM
ncbi:MAG: hypothetical protein J3Q66DRAFT_331308 [Benniella sp.]|nr:MAG: hypothetical protein J3Q66DRAFT_331308 [Benniella sp.]